MKNISKPLVLVLAIVLILVSTGLPVGAQSQPEGGTTNPGDGQVLEGSGINAVVPGGPGSVMIHPTAFIPISSTGEWSFGSGGYLYNPGSLLSYYEAAVNLPSGASITKFVLYYYDDSTSDLWAVLAKYDVDTNQTSVLANVDSTGASADNRTIEYSLVPPPVVDNQSNAYWLEVSLPGNEGSNLEIRGIRIDYSYPVSLPLINK